MHSTLTAIILLGITLSAHGAERPAAPWPPPPGPLNLIIDTDAANEVDDQWAIALALGYPERLKIEGFVAAHYGQRGGSKGIAKSRSSLEETLSAAGMAGKFTIKDGSDPFTYRDRPPESEGVDFIIARARAATPERPLWLVLLGPATNGAAALIKAPDIADRVIIFWHGRSEWPRRCANFNAQNDLLAAQVLFDTPCRLILFDTGTNLTMPMEETERRVAGVGPLGKFLYDIRKKSKYASRADKGIFDLGDIAALVDERTCKWEVVDAPTVRFDYGYDFAKTNGKVVRISEIDRDQSFVLLDRALQAVAKQGKDPVKQSSNDAPDQKPPAAKVVPER